MSSSAYDWTNAKPPGETPIINSIFDFSAEALGQLKVYLEQSGLNIPINQVIGFTQQQRVYARTSTQVDINNTATQKTMYDGATATATTGWRVNAGDLSTDKILRLTMTGDALFNNNAANTVTWRVVFGGTTVAADAATLDGITSATRAAWWWQVLVANIGSTASQTVASTLLLVPPSVGTATTGVGRHTSVANQYVPTGGVIVNSATIDTSVAVSLDATVQWSAASANNSWRRRYAVLELI